MIDFEPEIFKNIRNALVNRYGEDFKIYGETVLSPSSFPCVCLEQSDNYTYTESSDSGDIENHAEVMFEVNVFSNKKTKFKSECKEILSVIDLAFARLNFIRTSAIPMSYDDGTIYRIVARYRAIVGKDGFIFRR